VPLTFSGGQATAVVGGDLHSRVLLDHALPLRTYRFDNRSALRGTAIVRQAFRLSDLGRRWTAVST